MSSGMNVKEAEKIADKMSYREAIMNCLHAKCVPYRKATKIKLNELLEIAENADKAYQQGRAETITELLENQKHDELSQKIAIDVLNRGIAKGKKDGAREFAKFLIDKGIDVVDLHAEFQEGRINND